MLQELNIKNIALIRELTVSFENGLNVLSGETGAGKSIVVDSVNLILGERGIRELIRSGEEKAFVEALVTVEDPAGFEECGIEPCDEMIVTRELTAAGKNTCRINGRMVPLGMLKQVMAKLINLHGQNQHQDIFEKKMQLEMLDRYAFAERDDVPAAMAQAYGAYRKVEKELSKLNTDEKERERMLDMLSYQLNEISAAALQAGEEEELENERRLIRNAEKIAYALNGAYQLLADSEGALERISAAVRMLGDVSSYNEKYGQIESVVHDAYYNLQEASYDLSSLAEDVVFDERRLNEIEERLSLISELKRKYGNSIEEILAFAEDAQKQYDTVENTEQEKARLEQELSRLKKRMDKAAEELSAARKAAAEQMSAELVGHLVDLGMKDAKFSVAFAEKAPAADGADDVEFFITLNRGEPEKPLAKVASGGEASRIMLAVKNIFAKKESVGTLIFDEIDTGISGNMARIVAEKLANISRERQVICVSHLPQITSMADVNFSIVKSGDEEGTVTTVHRLGDEEKLREIARLSGGIYTDAALAHAKEMLAECEAFKKKA